MTADLQDAEDAAWPWPDALDALRAAPRHHALLFENERVRVLETRIPPGELVPVHTHRWPSVFHIISSSDFIRRDARGEIEIDSRVGSRGAPPSIVWSEALPPHLLENVGTTEIRVVSVELKPGLR
jgi:hypothetical protein